MRRWAFLAVAGEREARLRLLEQLGLLSEAAGHGLSQALELRGCTLLMSAGTPCLLLKADRGAILGSLLKAGSDSRERLEELEDGARDRIVASEGRELIEHHWGGYVALICAQTVGLTVLRDPSGAVHVYFCEQDGIAAYTSDPGLLVKLGLADTQLDIEFRRQWLLYRHLRTARTGLAAVKELLPGTARTTSARSASVATMWSPWAFTQRDGELGDFDEAAARLRSTVLRTVPACANGAERPLLELSGGLDSSIVASALANAGTRFASVNFATSASDGDERRYARMIAAKTGAPLREVLQQGRRSDLLREPPPQIRPGLSPVLAPIHELFTIIADEEGADLYLSGAGGDSVFCYLTTVAPALDAARRRGAAAALVALGEVARISGCTFWTASRYAFRKALRFKPSKLWPEDRSFLTDAAAEAPPDPHPWLDAPAGVLPGKREHVEAIVAIHYFLDRGFRGREGSVSYPLLAQPIVELCLRIPTWLGIRNGRNRSVARQAFEGLVPGPILSRGGKGRLESMCADAYAASRPQLRALLLDGRLASDNLIDRAAVEAYLRRPPERDDPRYFRIFDLATLELWQRAWERA